VQETTDVSNLTRTEREPYANVSSRALIAALMVLWERDERRPAIISRTIEPVRAELRRCETLGYDDPFESPYPEITW
jgi:hypothetical protein